MSTPFNEIADANFCFYELKKSKLCCELKHHFYCKRKFISEIASNCV